jgi:hypothetical protein
MKRLSLALGATFLVSLASCGEDDGLTPCTDFTECESNEICSPAGVCVDENATVCSDDTNCPAGETCDSATATCTGGGGGGGSCTDDTDCATGEMCDAGVCVPESTGECVEDVDCPGSDFGEVCVNMTCVTPMCDSLADCAPNGELCQDDPANPDFDMCVPADDVTSGCAPTVVWGEAREMGGPVIIDVSFLGNATLEDEMECTNENALSFQATVYTEDGLSGSIFTQGIKQLRGMDSGMDAERLTFSEGPSSPSHPSVADLGGNEFNVVFSLCRASMMEDVFAVMILDADGDQSNGFCFNVGSM